MHDSLLFGFAAVLLSGVCAGSIDSSNGNARVTPVPRRNVRRERDFFVMNIRPPTISLAFEMVHSSQFPESETKTGNPLMPHPGSPTVRRACRNIEPRGQGHR